MAERYKLGVKVTKGVAEEKILTFYIDENGFAYENEDGEEALD